MDNAHALDVNPGEKVELQATNRLGVPLHKRAQNSLKGRIQDGTIAEVTDTIENGHWLKLNLSDGRDGWIIEKYVAKVISFDEDDNNTFDGETIKVATWNIAHLRDKNDEGLVKRKDNDYQKLKEIANDLDADIIAVQEIENEDAIKRVFDSNTYNYFINKPSVGNRVRQFTGFVVKKDINFTVNPEFSDLNIGNPNLRSGADITLNFDNDKKLRLLSIHLKSRCFTGDLETPRNDSCEKLSEQVPILEKWIDERADEDIPFIVLGDFNRRMNDRDELWNDIDDSIPANSDLVRIPDDSVTQDCWKFSEYIDFFVLDKRASQLVDSDSFTGIRIPEDATKSRESKLSDHCPIAIDVNID